MVGGAGRSERCLKVSARFFAESRRNVREPMIEQNNARVKLCVSRCALSCCVVMIPRAVTGQHQIADT